MILKIVVMVLLTSLLLCSKENFPIDYYSTFKNYPNPDTIIVNGNKYHVKYSNDRKLTLKINSYFQKYRIRYATVIVSDMYSGKILSVVELNKKKISNKPNLVFGGRYPAASLIKILTAATALQSNIKYLTDSIPQKGNYHTLYSRQFSGVSDSYKHKISIEEAFANSVNPAFAILGMGAGPDSLKKYSVLFGFNSPIRPNHDITSRITIPESGMGLAQVSCGYNKETTISALHALNIMKALSTDGVLEYCSFSDTIIDLQTNSIINTIHDTLDLERVSMISDSNITKLQKLMEGTVDFGTARKGFGSIFDSSYYEDYIMGGKTGHMNGKYPRGTYDWFSGYAKNRTSKSGIVITVMIVQNGPRRMKSNTLAAKIIKDWIDK